MLFSSVYNSKGQRVVALPPDVPSTPTAGLSNRKRGRQELDSNAEDPLSRERPVKRQGKQRQMVVASGSYSCLFSAGPREVEDEVMGEGEILRSHTISDVLQRTNNNVV